jgi:iron complex transport system ATP-binding protein
MLTIENLTAAYGEKIVLEELSLELSRGEVLALIGPNGSGKTTLFRAISGVLPLKAGCVRVDGRDLASLSTAQRARYLAVVPQARRLPPAFTVRQTVLFGRTPYLGWLGQPERADLQRVAWVLEQTGLASLADQRVDELSGGEQQRVLLARALAQDTPLLLLDEPTAHLDLEHQSSLLRLVQSLAREQQLGVFMAVHDLNLVSLYADRVVLLFGGRLYASGTPKEVLVPEILNQVYRASLHILPHPVHGTPLVLLDGYTPREQAGVSAPPTRLSPPG